MKTSAAMARGKIMNSHILRLLRLVIEENGRKTVNYTATMPQDKSTWQKWTIVGSTSLYGYYDATFFD